jgi:hypothetical protein
MELSTTSASASRVKSSTTRQHPEAPAPGQHVGHEVERPALVRRLRDCYRRPRAGRALSATPAAHRQTFLAVEPEQLLPVHGNAFPFEQDAEAPVAEAPPLPRELA